MLKYEAEQTAPDVLTDEQLELVSAGLFKEMIEYAQKGYTATSGCGLGIVGGTVGAVYGFFFG